MEILCSSHSQHCYPSPARYAMLPTAAALTTASTRNDSALREFNRRHSCSSAGKNLVVIPTRVRQAFEMYCSNDVCVFNIDVVKDATKKVQVCFAGDHVVGALGLYAESAYTCWLCGCLKLNGCLVFVLATFVSSRRLYSTQQKRPIC